MSQSVSTDGTEENQGGPAPNTPSHYVGIGASAGGLEALDAFFESMPPDSGMSFVVVQHLSPQHKSLMVELLSKRTEMPVRRAEHGMSVEPNAVYLIPPSKNLSVNDGKLKLSEMDSPHGVNLPIDFFLRSLAEDQGDRSVAIVLSGTGSDGMRGVRAVKEAGGLVMVQDVDSAKFDGMPRSAISTGLADFILAPQEMPRQLINFVQHPYARKDAGGARTLLSEEENMAEVFSLLRERTGVDFTYYKPNTVVRRVERRMSVTQTRGLREYLHYLRTSPREVGALKKELLIGVTSFFRDREAFDFLEEHVLPKLFEEADGGSLRFWVAGCSSGEEAYGLAIVCRKYMEQSGKAYDVKIFATDIDPDVVEQAGAGVYPESIAADIDNALLARFFVKRGEHYHIPRSIREMVVFAQHNVVKDPPFTRIDLLSCRNLLIYLQPVLQKKALSLFQFSVRSGGYLFLGSSESVGDLSDHFELVSSKWKVYRARSAGRPNLTQALATPQHGGLGMRVRGPAVPPQDDDRLLDRVLQTLAGSHMPPGAIVNQNHEIVHVVGDISEFFTVPAGRISTDISKLAMRDLSVPIATGLHRVFQGGRDVSYENIHVPGRDGATRLVNLHLRPVAERRGQEPLAVVLVETVDDEHDREDGGDGAERYNVNKEAEHRISDLEQELQYTKENLQATIEELETSNEELQATNEELLASNEELQSTNEELQSVNEELYTVNAEYQAKIVELTNLTNDIDNLLRSTGVSTLFLDMKLCIRKFTPGITEILNVVDHDLGRPVVHFNPALSGIDLHKELRRVRDDEVSVEVEVQTNDGSWYLLRALPYRTEQNVVDGLVVAFIDITAFKRSEAGRKGVESQLAHERDVLRVVTDTTSSGILIYAPDGNLTFANPQAARVLDVTLESLRNRGYNDPAWEVREPDGSPVPEDQLPFRQTLEQRREIRDRILDVRTGDGGPTVRLRVNSAPLLDDQGNVDAIVLTLLRAEEDE